MKNLALKKPSLLRWRCVLTPPPPHPQKKIVIRAITL